LHLINPDACIKTRGKILSFYGGGQMSACDLDSNDKTMLPFFISKITFLIACFICSRNLWFLAFLLSLREEAVQLLGLKGIV